MNVPPLLAKMVLQKESMNFAASVLFASLTNVMSQMFVIQFI